MAIIRGSLYVGASGVSFVPEERFNQAEHLPWQVLKDRVLLEKFLEDFKPVAKNTVKSVGTYYLEAELLSLEDWFSRKTSR
ncbi:MAG: hypothetical protein K8F91_25530 [Candidatus Obscuribacterales bacterium]|nr:hypothetical protein [Candidatus Obscuribacterales bacterium]